MSATRQVGLPGLSEIIQNAIDVLGRALLVGTTLTRPILAKGDGVSTTYACDVQILGHTEPLRNVPIASDAGVVHFAEPGSAVTLWKVPTTGKLEIIGLAKQKPGFLHLYAVDLSTGAIGTKENVGPSSRILALGELGSFGGGFGRCPLGAYAVYDGDTLVDVRA